jgi:hypothetical protein
LACLIATGTKAPTSLEKIGLPGISFGSSIRGRNRWAEHFEWVGAELTGRTAIGPVTVHVLAINAPDFLAVRAALVEER